MSLLLSAIRRAPARAAPSAMCGYLSFEESRFFMRPYEFRGMAEFLEWSRSGGRPAFIPTNPSRTYRECGWISWADWLGYEKEVKQSKASSVTRSKRHASANSVKTAFVDFVSQRRPEMEFRQLPKTLKASHLFRMRSLELSKEQATPDLWIPLQIRFKTPIGGDNKRGPIYLLRQTATEDTPVIVISPSGEVVIVPLGSGNQVYYFSPSDFRPPDIVFDYLDQWWRSASRKETEEDIVRELRGRGDRRGILSGSGMERLCREYLDPLHLSWKRSGDVTSPANVVIAGRHKVILRGVSSVNNKFYATVQGSVRGKPIAESDSFDFVLVMMDCGVNHADQGLALFLFPRSVLVEWNIVGSSSSPGKPAIYVYPPWKESKKSMTDVRKKEQAPFFVDNPDRFAQLLQRFGGAA